MLKFQGIDLTASEASFLSFFSDILGFVVKFKKYRRSKAVNKVFDELGRLYKIVPIRAVRISRIMVAIGSGRKIPKNYSTREVFVARRFISANGTTRN